MGAALRGERDADVPCGDCTACCRSSQFVHVDPDEADTLAHVPAALRFPAPGLRRGHVVLGYDDQGRCPMLGSGGCTIYEHRPRACRTYDCRVFAAAGVDPDAPLIAERVRCWSFEYPADEDRAAHDAVRAAARSVAAAPGRPAPGPTQAAVEAVAGVAGLRRATASAPGHRGGEDGGRAGRRRRRGQE